MKRLSLFFCMILATLGLSSCDTYVDGGYAYRPGYRSGVAYAPGYVRPGYARPYYSGYRPGYYGNRSAGWNAYNRVGYNRPTYTPRGYPHSHLSPGSYRRDDDHGSRWSNGNYSRGARTNTRVNVGPVGLSNYNRVRF